MMIKTIIKTIRKTIKKDKTKYDANPAKNQWFPS